MNLLNFCWIQKRVSLDHSSFAFIPGQMHRAMQNTSLPLFHDRRQFFQWKQQVALPWHSLLQEKAQQNTWLPKDSINLVVCGCKQELIIQRLKVNINLKCKFYFGGPPLISIPNTINKRVSESSTL